MVGGSFVNLLLKCFAEQLRYKLFRFLRIIVSDQLCFCMFMYTQLFRIGWGSSFEPIGCRCDPVCYRIAGEAMVVEPDDPWLLGGVTPHGVEPDDPSMLDRPQLGGRLDGRRLRCLPDCARCAETMRHGRSSMCIRTRTLVIRQAPPLSTPGIPFLRSNGLAKLPRW